MLTNPITEVKDLAADLLFVLCKESGKIFVGYSLQIPAQHFYLHYLSKNNTASELWYNVLTDSDRQLPTTGEHFYH